MGVIGNRQGFLGEHYPEYAPYPGSAATLSSGLIKMNEFVVHCGRDRVPSSGSRHVGDRCRRHRREAELLVWVRP